MAVSKGNTELIVPCYTMGGGGRRTENRDHICIKPRMAHL